MVYEVYLDPCTINCRKVLAGLDHMNVDYHLNHVDYFKGEQKADWFTKINPHATVPAATDGDLVLTESNAIMTYGADIQEGGHSAFPRDLKLRAKVNCWLLWETSVWFPSCYVYLVQNVVQPLLGNEPDQKILDAESDNWHKNAAVLEAQLNRTKWLVSDEPTLADIAVASPMHLWEEQKLPLDKYPKLKNWYVNQVAKLPAWQNTQGAVDKALLPNKSAAKQNGTVNGQSSSVQTTLNYTKDLDQQLTELYFYETEKAKGIHEPGDDPQVVSVHDGWYRAKEFSIDREGFSLEDFHTGFSEWENEEKVREVFYPQVVQFLKRTTGAKRVLVFDHTIRTKANDAKKLTQESNTSQRAPVMLVHCDYTDKSGVVRVKQLLPDEADDLLSRRVAFINVWKPVRNVVEERPLAMCDVRTTPDDDFFKLYLNYRDRVGENYVMKHSPSHKWWYFPRMTPDQVILLKTFDSETDGRARFVGHSAFEDPNTPADAKTRESIEIRTIAFF